MQPQIRLLEEKKLIGVKLEMNLAQDKTGQLWGSFMPRRKEIENRVSNDLYSIQVYPHDYFSTFSPAKMFVKWAAVEVPSHENIPKGMSNFTLENGMYAVFYYKGLSTDKTIYQNIFTKWLPNSDYILENRPHFEVLGLKYKNDHPDSEEEIWVPVKKKA